MTREISREQLEGLLVDPIETLDFEMKNWLDLQGSNDDKATFAKAVLAIANHGGGFIALGLHETDTGTVEAEGRPATFDGYSQDLINGIVGNYCDPTFHCAVHIVRKRSTDRLFPIVRVPGGHRVPIRARRGGPNGNIVENNAIYIRKPGPKSEMPQGAQEWNDLLGRCLQNRRDEMFDQIRNLISGAVPQVEKATKPARLEEWSQENLERWRALIKPHPEGTGPRFPHGWYYFSYEIIGDRRKIKLADFPAILMASVAPRRGCPPFWYPPGGGLEPYPVGDGVVECWLGADPKSSAMLSDFWRIHPDGLAFLLRGFQEDSGIGVPPATAFDILLPVREVGEAILHAGSLANKLFDGPSTVRFTASYEGLAGRSLTSFDRKILFPWSKVARQNSITLETHIDTQTIDSNLPEIVHPFLSDLYVLFDFFDLQMELVVQELARMRGR